MSVIHFQPARSNWASQVHRANFDQAWERAFDLNFRGFPFSGNAVKEVADWSPAVDVRETDKDFQINVDVPGVAAKNLEITSDKGVLTIRGTRDGETESEEPNRYRRVERAYGKFERRFTLPETANVEAIQAKTADGVLTVTIPKREAVQPRRIEIAAA